MEMVNQLHVPAALLAGTEAPVSILQETVWVPEVAWTF
jgi:hypothetical protein